MSKNFTDFEATLNRDFSTLWSRHKRMVYRWAFKANAITGVEYDDLVSEGMILFHDRMIKFNPSKIKSPETFNFSHMIYRPLNNIIRKYKTKKMIGIQATADSTPKESGSDQRDAYSTHMNHYAHYLSNRHVFYRHCPINATIDAIEQEAWETLEKEFSFSQRNMVRLRAEGQTLKQISDTLDVPVAIVRKQLTVALKQACEFFGVVQHPVRGFTLEGL